MAYPGKQYGEIITTPMGAVTIVDDGEVLLRVEPFRADDVENLTPSALTEEAKRQLLTYFADADFQFDLPIVHTGTAFQRRVWQALCEIPRGQVLTYGEMAKKLCSHARAIGGACRRNPTALVVPCHRVVATGRNGGISIGGFSGQWLEGDKVDSKSWLLQHEGVCHEGVSVGGFAQ